MAPFSTNVGIEPQYIDFIDIGAGYGVLTVPVDGFFPGDQVQLCTMEIAPTAGGNPTITESVDLVQRSQGFFQYDTSLSISAHFTLTAANIATIAAGAFSYSCTVSILRNGVTISREVQAGTIAARSGSAPPPLIVASVVITGGPVTGTIGDTTPLVATAYDGLGNPILGAVIVWSSSNALIAEVDQSGLVSFIMPGAAAIIATCQGIQDNTTATTTDPAFVSPQNMQVAGYLTSDAFWRPRFLTAEWIGPGVFQGGDVFEFQDGITVSGGIITGDGSGITNLPAAGVTGIVTVPHGGTGLATVASGNLLVGAGTSAMTALAPGAVAGFVRSNGSAWVRAAIVTADISDLTSATTGITKVGTVTTGVWNGTVVSTSYTQAQLITLAGTSNRVAVSGTATDPIVDIAATYVGQTSLTTLGTVTTGTWHGTAIGTAYTVAQLVTLTGTADKITIGGTSTDPTVTIAATYAGQTSIVTVGTIATGTWNGSAIAVAYTEAQIVSVGGTSNRISVGGTSTAPTIDIAAGYIGQGSITTLGTIGAGVWQGTSIATAYTDAKIKTVAGTVNRVTIGGTSTDPTFDIAAAYVGQTSITTLGTITTGTWHGTVIATAYTAAQVVTLTGTSNRITIGGTTTDPTVDVSTSYAGQATITTLGTIATGVWQGTSIATTYTDAKIKTVTGTSNRLSVGGTATDPIFDISASYVGQTSITSLGTVTTGTWAATTIAATAGGTGLTTYALGDTLYGSGVNTLGKLAGNVTTSKKFLNQTGDGAASAAPAWSQIVTADISDLTSATTGITKVGTVTTGTWNAGVVGPQYGGTGVNNASSTITLGGSVVTAGAVTVAGAFGLTLTITALTSLTLPTSGTLVNSAVTALTSLASVGTIGTGVWQGTAVGVAYGGTSYSSYVAGDILYAGGTTTMTKLAIGAANTVMTSTGTAPQWSASLTGLTSVSATSLVGTLTTAAQPNITSVGVLVSPHMTGAIVDSGGLRVTAGNLSVGTAATASQAIRIDTALLTGTTQESIASGATFGSGATTAGRGLTIGVGTAAASYVMTSLENIRVLNASAGAGSTITTQYGLLIDALTSGGTNYAIYTGTGLVSLGDALTVRAGGAAITGAVTMSSTLGVTGHVSLTSDISILGSANKYLSGNTTDLVLGNDDASATVQLRAAGVSRVVVSAATTAISNSVVVATGLTVTAGGLTVSSGTTAVQALTATSVTATGDIKAGSGANLGFTSSTQLEAPSDGVLTLFNAARNGFTRLNFGANSSASFPALKRSSTALQVRLSDDSDYATLNAKLVSEGAAASTGASEIAYGGTVQSTVGAAGGASALPATPTGYIIVNVAGTNRVIPYYAAS